MSSPEKIEIRTPDGTADAWAFKPDGKGPWPGVVFFVDAGGVRPIMREMAARVASLGYVVLLPNTLYRAGDFKPFDLNTVFGDPAERARLMAIIKQVDGGATLRDGGAYLDALAKVDGVKPGSKVGVMGYCLGGRMAFATAGNYPDRVGAVASFHGGGLVTPEPDSPHAKIDKIKARIYLGVADNDQSCSPEAQAALASGLAAAHVGYQIELYAGKAHGFAVADHGVFDQGAADLHWRRIEETFASAL
jgi:carboxymethylenebutenolidase